MFACTEAVHDLLATYAMNDEIADTVSNIHSLTQRSGIPAMVYLDAMWAKVLRCAQVQDEAQLKRLFFERPQPSVCDRVLAYRRTNEK